VKDTVGFSDRKERHRELCAKITYDPVMGDDMAFLEWAYRLPSIGDRIHSHA